MRIFVFDCDGLKPLMEIESLSQLTTRNKFTTEEFATLSKYKTQLIVDTHPYTTWEGFGYYRYEKCGRMNGEFSGVDLKRSFFV